MNPWDFETIQVLTLEYRSNNDIKSLRDTWNYILQIRPLVAREWREWIQDDQEDALELYKRATQESADVQLWEEYLDFLKEAQVNDLLEEMHRATACAGWHFTKGYKIWERVFGFLIEQYEGNVQEEEDVRKQFYKRAEMLMDDVSFDSLLVLYSGFETKVGKDYEDKMKKFNSLVFKQKKECKKRDGYELLLLEVMLILSIERWRKK